MPAANRSTQSDPNRRSFLKSASVASLASSTLVPAALRAGVHAAGDETIKVALIGCGSRGTGAAAQALSTKGPVKLWAMADAFADRLAGSLKNLNEGQIKRYDREATGGLGSQIDVPPERQFVGLDAYRKAVDCGVDLVLLCGPPAFRPRHFQYAVEAGKHVFMEKPLATDAPGVRQVLAVAEKADQLQLKVGVGLQRHHQASYQEAVRRIHDGELGQLLTLRGYWNGGPPAKKPFPRQPGMSELEYQVRNWYFFHWLSGDHICEQHIHNLDVCNWIMQGHPVEAQGQGGRQVRTGAQYGNIFDHHAVEFTYADGTKMFSQCRQIPGCYNQVAEAAVGSLGAAQLNMRQASIQVAGTEAWRSPRRRQGERENPYQVEHDRLFEAIRTGRRHNEARYGALSTMTAILGRMATYSGKRVRWEQAFDSQIELTTSAEQWQATAPVQPDPDGGYPVAVPGITQVV